MVRDARVCSWFRRQPPAALSSAAVMHHVGADAKDSSSEKDELQMSPLDEESLSMVSIPQCAEEDCAADPNSLHRAISPILVTAQIFALLPVCGVRGRSVASLEFRRCSIRALWTVLMLVGNLVMTTLATLQLFTMELTFDNSANAVFFGTSSVTMLLFLQLAKRWSALATRWAAVEADMRPYGFPRRLALKLNLLAAAVMIVALVEHLLSYLTEVEHALRCPREGVTWVETYFKSHFPEVFGRTRYAHWKGALVLVVKIVAAFTWNFIDLFVMVLAIAMTQRMRQVNARLRAAKCKSMPEGFWRAMRQDFDNLSCLTKTVDSYISKIVLLSFGSNLYFICVQLLNTIKPMTASNFEAVYFYFSFIYLLVRTCAVSLFAAGIHDESREPRSVLYSVPPDSYCVEVQRFLMQVVNDDVAFTGLNFFSITRTLMLTHFRAQNVVEMMMLLKILLCAAAVSAGNLREEDTDDSSSKCKNRDTYVIKSASTNGLLVVNTDTFPPEVIASTKALSEMNSAYLYEFEIIKSTEGDAYMIRTVKDKYILLEGIGNFDMPPVIVSNTQNGSDIELWRMDLEKDRTQIRNKGSKRVMLVIMIWQGIDTVHTHYKEDSDTMSVDQWKILKKCISKPSPTKNTNEPIKITTSSDKKPTPETNPDEDNTDSEGYNTSPGTWTTTPPLTKSPEEYTKIPDKCRDRDTYIIRSTFNNGLLVVNTETDPPEVIVPSEEIIEKKPEYLHEFEIIKSAEGDAYVIRTVKDKYILLEGINTYNLPPVISSKIQNGSDIELWRMDLEENRTQIRNKGSKRLMLLIKKYQEIDRVHLNDNSEKMQHTQWKIEKRCISKTSPTKNTNEPIKITTSSDKKPTPETKPDGHNTDSEGYNTSPGSWTTTPSLTKSPEEYTKIPDDMINSEGYDTSPGSWTTTPSLTKSPEEYTKIPDDMINSEGYNTSPGPWTTTPSLTTSPEEHTKIPDDMINSEGYNTDPEGRQFQKGLILIQEGIIQMQKNINQIQKGMKLVQKGVTKPGCYNVNPWQWTTNSPLTEYPGYIIGNNIVGG